jgi:hypothetical protein
MSSDRILERADAALDRARSRATASSGAKSAARRAARATKYSAVGIALVLLGALVWGMITPLGVTGVIVTALAMLAVIVMSIIFSREAPVSLDSIRKVELKALPQTTGRWLDGQRRLLPAPAQSLVDGIGVKLDTLGLQLQTLDEREPAALEVRRLIADELPELVNGYHRVPPALRREDRNGLNPDRQLVEGLAVVDSELQRMSEQLASGDLNKLATQGRYLELKYQGDPAA